MISSNSLFTEEQLETLWNLALQGRSQNHVFDSFENKTGEISQLHLNSDDEKITKDNFAPYWTPENGKTFLGFLD